MVKDSWHMSVMQTLDFNNKWGFWVVVDYWLMTSINVYLVLIIVEEPKGNFWIMGKKESWRACHLKGKWFCFFLSHVDFKLNLEIYMYPVFTGICILYSHKDHFNFFSIWEFQETLPISVPWTTVQVLTRPPLWCVETSKVSENAFFFS